MTARRRRYFSHEEKERRWPSLVLSVSVTAASFVFAFEAMRSVPALLNYSRSSDVDERVILQFPKPVVPPRVVTPLPRVREKARPSETPPPPAALPPVAAPVAAPAIASPIERSSAPRDSGGASSRSASSASSLGVPSRADTGRRAPIGPAWTRTYERPASTPQRRDSIMREKADEVPGIARVHEPTGRERAELEQGQREAALLRRRTSSAGNSADLVILEGRGLHGVGAVSGPGVVSVGVPLLSSGPSAAQRKKNEQIDDDYQLRLRRLQDRMYLKQDSIRADSVRLDSLRRDSLAKRRRTPLP